MCRETNRTHGDSHDDTIGSSDPQWQMYVMTCLGDAIKYTADRAQEAKIDPTRSAAPDRQVGCCGLRLQLVV